MEEIIILFIQFSTEKYIQLYHIPVLTPNVDIMQGQNNMCSLRAMLYKNPLWAFGFTTDLPDVKVQTLEYSQRKLLLLNISTCTKLRN